MVGRAALNIANQNQTYFFRGDKYVKINWTPGKTNDNIAYGPIEFVKEWVSLKETGFKQIDAILPVPGRNHRAYFFSGSRYARIEYVPGAPGDKVLGGVRPIKDNWMSITEAGFDTIDGGLMVPGSPEQAYIFSGEQYCRISFNEGQNDDQLLEGPKAIATGWSGIQLKSIDTIIPEPESNQGAYAFSGSRYVRFNVAVGGYDELITGPKDVAPYWPSLKKAGFY
ncbi:Hemopexin [Ceratobasidium sp. AG-I]|nr:Hemopexin [Ceratobasidium sp. AG-I]